MLKSHMERSKTWAPKDKRKRSNAATCSAPMAPNPPTYPGVYIISSLLCMCSRVQLGIHDILFHHGKLGPFWILNHPCLIKEHTRTVGVCLVEFLGQVSSRLAKRRFRQSLSKWHCWWKNPAPSPPSDHVELWPSIHGHHVQRLCHSPPLWPLTIFKNLKNQIILVIR